MMKFTCLAMAASLALSSACASHPPPTDHLASAIAAIRGAQVAVAGAGRVPEAALHLKLAEEQVSEAREMIERGDNERADYMTLRAFNDAELALALAREQQARLAADEARAEAASAVATPRVGPEDAVGNASPEAANAAGKPEAARAAGKPSPAQQR